MRVSIHRSQTARGKFAKIDVDFYMICMSINYVDIQFISKTFEGFFIEDFQYDVESSKTFCI